MIKLVLKLNYIEFKNKREDLSKLRVIPKINQEK
jgi:hypothetical protein